MTLYNHDAHLAEEDEQLFDHHARSWRKKSARAASDLIRDLKRRGYLDDPDHAFLDDFAKATCTVAFAASGGQLTVPAGAVVVALDPEFGQVLADVPSPARLRFTTDEELVVADGQTGTVTATAEHPGTPYNVEAGWLSALEEDAPANFASVTNDEPATGGADHQLTRAAVYRAMELVMMDLMREPDDVFDARRRLYAKMYAEEIERLVASGLDVDADGDGQASEGEQDTYEHGRIHLRRS